jgi:hypothetical protein
MSRFIYIIQCVCISVVVLFLFRVLFPEEEFLNEQNDNSYDCRDSVFLNFIDSCRSEKPILIPNNIHNNLLPPSQLNVRVKETIVYRIFNNVFVSGIEISVAFVRSEISIVSFVWYSKYVQNFVSCFRLGRNNFLTDYFHRCRQISFVVIFVNVGRYGHSVLHFQNVW